MPLDKKCEKSHFVIDNNGSVEEAENSAMSIYNIIVPILYKKNCIKALAIFFLKFSY